MVRIFAFTLIGIGSMKAGSWATSEGSSDSADSRLEGTVTTQENKKFTVNDIKIGNLYKDIPVYSMQSNKGSRLTKNPADTAKIFLDLSNIQKIGVPDSDKIWDFPKDSKKYIEIMVVSTNNTENHYLIETRHKITCKDVNGSTKVEIPFTDLTSLVIGSKNKVCPTVCTHGPQEAANKAEAID
jgi:hypothetical protein